MMCATPMRSNETYSADLAKSQKDLNRQFGDRFLLNHHSAEVGWGCYDFPVNLKPSSGPHGP